MRTFAASLFLLTVCCLFSCKRHSQTMLINHTNGDIHVSVDFDRTRWDCCQWHNASTDTLWEKYHTYYRTLSEFPGVECGSRTVITNLDSFNPMNTPYTNRLAEYFPGDTNTCFTVDTLWADSLIRVNFVLSANGQFRLGFSSPYPESQYEHLKVTYTDQNGTAQVIDLNSEQIRQTAKEMQLIDPELGIGYLVFGIEVK